MVRAHVLLRRRHQLNIPQPTLSPKHPSFLEPLRCLFLTYSYRDHQLRRLSISKETMASYLLQGFDPTDGWTGWLEESGELVGLAQVRPCPWQSQHLGVRVGFLQHFVLHPAISIQAANHLAERMRHAIQGQVDLLYARPATADVKSIQALEAIGLRLVGQEVTGIVPCDVEPLTESPCPIVEARNEHLPRICEIIQHSHTHNHYAYDPHIPQERVTDLFTGLIKEDLAKQHRGLLVAEDERGQAQGFIRYKWNQKLTQVSGIGQGSLDFIGVHPDTQCRGLGEALNRSALLALQTHSVPFATVRTMSTNYAALAALRCFGFRITSASSVLHGWW